MHARWITRHWVRPVLLLGLLPLAALGGVQGTACAAATLPPDLVALEQQMAQLQANSERFSFQEELALPGLVPGGAPLVLIVAGKGEGSDSPAQASVVGGLAGLPQERIRQIGQSVYHYRGEVAGIDGGRPWVRSSKPAAQGSGLDPGGLLENDQAGRQGTFSKLVEQLNGALSVQESGPATVDGQRTIEFEAALDPSAFLEQLKSESKEPKHPFDFGSPLETSPVRSRKAPAKPAPPPTLELEIFIAPNGLPVRARYTFADEHVTVAVRVDTIAINIPVSVAAPPASKTIGEAQLERIERRRAAREERKALRRCRRLRGLRARECRAVARAKGRVPSSGASPL